MWVNSSGNTIFTPRTTTVLGEEEESDLVMLTGMSLKDPGQWKKGSTFNATITNGTNEFTLRVVNTTTLSQIDAPSGSFTVVGIGGQFDSSNPYTDGYQLLPRKSEDLVPTVSTRNLIGDQVSVFPILLKISCL